MVWPCALPVDAYVAAGRRVEFPRPDCPSCAGPMVFWSGYWRHVREAGRCQKIFVPRLRCARCRVTHALLPAFVLAGRLDTAEMAGLVIEEAVGGGARPAAERAGVPHTTAREWLRRFRSRAGQTGVAFAGPAVAEYQRNGRAAPLPWNPVSSLTPAHDYSPAHVRAEGCEPPPGRRPPPGQRGKPASPALPAPRYAVRRARPGVPPGGLIWGESARLTRPWPPVADRPTFCSSHAPSGQAARRKPAIRSLTAAVRSQSSADGIRAGRRRCPLPALRAPSPPRLDPGALAVRRESRLACYNSRSWGDQREGNERHRRSRTHRPDAPCTRAGVRSGRLKAPPSAGGTKAGAPSVADRTAGARRCPSDRLASRTAGLTGRRHCWRSGPSATARPSRGCR